MPDVYLSACRGRPARFFTQPWYRENRTGPFCHDPFRRAADQPIQQVGSALDAQHDKLRPLVLGSQTNVLCRVPQNQPRLD